MKRKMGFGECGTVVITDGNEEFEVDYADFGRQVECIRDEDGEELDEREFRAIEALNHRRIDEAVADHIADMAEAMYDSYREDRIAG